MISKAIFRDQWSFGEDIWALKACQLDENLFVCSSSSGQIAVFSISAFNTPILQFKAHDTSINDLIVISNKLVASCSEGGVKVWDLSTPCTLPVHFFTNDKNSNFLSLAVNPESTILAAGDRKSVV